MYAQESSVVTWSYQVKAIQENQYLIHIKGAISSGWILYDQDKADQLEGVVVKYTPSLLADPIQIQSKPTFVNDLIYEKKKKVFINSIELEQKITISDSSVNNIQATITYNVSKENNFIPEETNLLISLSGDSIVSKRLKIPTIDINHPISNCGVAPIKNDVSKSLGSLFFIGFLGGLIALLTPCVFPMIPLTVSFFTKKATNKKSGIKNAFLYGFFIFFIYVLLSLPFHFLDSINPAFLNNISTNVYLNVFFFLIFIFFAFSFFGFYEISLPASFSTGADSKAGAGNIFGIFFMALTLALVSFSCTGPILGSLLAGSLVSDGGAMQLTAGMGGFGLALALPFALFALFPNWLQSLPKSGGWLNSVKVVLGFLEIALAFKFLSNADLVMHWGLLKREIFIGIWILVGLGLTFYLFGKIKFSHDSDTPKISSARKVIGFVVGCFTLYLLPGVTNTNWANLKLISGFPPPLYYSIYKKESDCVLGFHCSKDYQEGIAMAKAAHKLILIDFTGYACVNCRRMEENIWSDPEVYKLMSENFIVISLYVDDKKELPPSEQFLYQPKEGPSKIINNYGDKWSTLEQENFQNNAQPFYAIINSEEQLANRPIGYTPDKKAYLEWLQCGIKALTTK